MLVRPSGSFRRYFVDPSQLEGSLASLRDELATRLHARRFRSIDRLGSERDASGWSSEIGTVPREFDLERVSLGDALVLSLRHDRKRLPPGAVRVRRLEAEAAERRNVGERMAPARRRAIQEQVESELYARTVPASTLLSALWRPQSGELLLSSTADAANVAFRALFRETFGATPQPRSLATLVARSNPAAALDDLAPALFFGA